MLLRRYVGTALVLIGLLAAAGPAAADPKKGLENTLVCGEDSYEVVMQGGAIHLVEGGNFLPKVVWVGSNPNPVVSNNGFESHNALDAVECTWVSSRGTHFRALGLFTPATP